MLLFSSSWSKSYPILWAGDAGTSWLHSSDSHTWFTKRWYINEMLAQDFPDKFAGCVPCKYVHTCVLCVCLWSCVSQVVKKFSLENGVKSSFYVKKLIQIKFQKSSLWNLIYLHLKLPCVFNWHMCWIWQNPASTQRATLEDMAIWSNNCIL